MKKLHLTNSHIIFLAAVCVIVAATVAIRILPVQRTDKSSDAGIQVPKSVPTGLPEPTSAKFASGDALQGLGANWTFLKQEDQRMLSMSFIAGTAPGRESVVQLVGNPKVSLTLEESYINDQKKLDAALAEKDVKKVTVAGREGYIVPMGSLAGGTALVLKGSTTILIIQDTNTELWPEELDTEVATYIATARVP